MLLGIFIAGALIVWTIGGLASLDLLPKGVTMNANTLLRKMKQWFDEPWEIAFYLVLSVSIATIGILYETGRVDWLVIAGGMTALTAGIVGLHAPEGSRIREIAPELVGIAIGVMAIDHLYQIRLEQQERVAIIRQLGSQSNAFALEAARLLREQGLSSDGSLEGAQFGYANLEGAQLGGTNLKGATLWQANLVGANLGYANLEGADLMHANLVRTYLGEANFERANLRWADLEGAYLGEANLEGAKLWSANLTGANLEKANLTEADLIYADFTGADLLGAILTGARYNNATRWPKDFDPKLNGAINWDGLSEEEQAKFSGRWTEK